MTYTGSGPGGGELVVPIPVPRNPFLDGLHVYFQFVVDDPGAQAGVAASPGLEVIVCEAD